MLSPSQIHAADSKRNWITYRCLMLPRSSHISNGSLRWIITPAPPSNGRLWQLCGRSHVVGRERELGAKGKQVRRSPFSYRKLCAASNISN